MLNGIVCISSRSAASSYAKSKGVSVKDTENCTIIGPPELYLMSNC